MWCIGSSISPPPGLVSVALPSASGFPHPRPVSHNTTYSVHLLVHNFWLPRGHFAPLCTTLHHFAPLCTALRDFLEASEASEVRHRPHKIAARLTARRGGWAGMGRAQPAVTRATTDRAAGDGRASVGFGGGPDLGALMAR